MLYCTTYAEAVDGVADEAAVGSSDCFLVIAFVLWGLNPKGSFFCATAKAAASHPQSPSEVCA